MDRIHRDPTRVPLIFHDTVFKGAPGLILETAVFP